MHTEWSWDAPIGHMERSCRRAIELGLPAIAFTEHADWALVHKGQHAVDIETRCTGPSTASGSGAR
ncbi:MAG: hypothetical protein E6I95_10030 [Chloroflexi bacterium]|nr:MAG: hypothetical protein E6I95_10030 [Chloroflexota bacterium]